MVSWGVSAGTLQAEGALDCVAHRRMSCSMSLSWLFGRGWSDGKAGRLLSGDTHGVTASSLSLRTLWTPLCGSTSLCTPSATHSPL